MRVAHVVSNLGNEASGPSHTVPALCAALARAGDEVRVHSVEPAPAQWPHAGVAHLAHPRAWLLSRLWASRSMRRALSAEAGHTDVLHAHGLWLMPNLYPLAVLRGTRCRLVVSPRGMLSEEAQRFSRVSKRLMWVLAQGAALRRADCLHATSLSERDEILAADVQRPVAVIPNGVYVPEDRPFERPADAPRRLLFLSRIHPKKGLDLLVPLWAELERERDDWELVIAGPDEGSHLDELRALARTSGCQRLRFHPPVFGAGKTALFRSADLFVLPTRNENFGMVIAEALAHGVPVVATRGAPWSGLVEQGCGWWVDVDREALGAALREALALSPDQLRSRGVAGQDWMRRCFAWDAIGREMHAVYQWLVGEGPRPACVHDP